MAKNNISHSKIKLSLFKNSFAELPDTHITLDEMANYIRDGKWKILVMKLRSHSDPKHYKKVKAALPAITVSGEFKTRDKFTPFKQRIIRHTGLICLDIDKKDNPKLSIKTVIDKDCLMQYVSCSGEGLKIIYHCEQTKDQAEHRRIYDAAVQRLAKKGIKLKVDPIVKSISSLQYVSYDPNVFYFPKSKLVITPLPAPKRVKAKPSEDQKKELEQLQEYIEALGDKDVTKDYEKWLTICFGLSYSLGEAGRLPFHSLSKNYAEYSKEECDEKYDSCLERTYGDPVDRPVTISSVYQILNDHLPKVAARQLTKKYNKGHAVGVGEDTEEGDLAGMVRYKLFLFKKVFDKKSNTLVELYPWDINLNTFEALLKSKGFYRYDDLFVHIKDNIVESVDKYDILRMVTDHVEQDGDYTFTYQKMEFKFVWEELVHLWRKVRGQSSIFNQIGASLTHWVPSLLKDTADISYIPYLNGVLQVDKKGYRLLPYSSIKAQIWRERILQRDFTYTQQIGMFEEFFGNVCSSPVARRRDLIKSDRYKRNLWYFGYMLHSFKIRSRARAWMLYDIKAGNNGRTGKSIMGQAIGHIRNVTTIDGKQLDLRNRFAFQKVTPWTEVIFIDDPHKGITLNPLFNMITGDTDTEGKGKDVLTLNLKVMIASNWIMEMEGTSEQGRQFVTQLDDFYVKFAVEKDTIQPLVDYHKKEFFAGWDAKDWNQFDSFCIRALQYYMGNDSPSNQITGNAAQVRFIQQHESEIFFELTMAFMNNVRPSKDGKLLVPQKVLVNVIKDSGDFTGIKAGRIVKEYLVAINAGKCTTTSILVGSITQMGYKLENTMEKLNFGDLRDQLPKVSWQTKNSHGGHFKGVKKSKVNT